MHPRVLARTLTPALLLLVGCAGSKEKPGKEPTAHVPQMLVPVIAHSRAKAAIGLQQGVALPPNDADRDGLDDARELELGTDPYWPDSDNDRLPDGFEVERGSDPRAPDVEQIASFRQRMLALDGHGEPGFVPLLINTVSCTMVGFNPTLCTATCTGSCLFGAVACYWAWDPVQYVIDLANSAPCPGWTCNCP